MRRFLVPFLSLSTLFVFVSSYDAVASNRHGMDGPPPRGQWVGEYDGWDYGDAEVTQDCMTRAAYVLAQKRAWAEAELQWRLNSMPQGPAGDKSAQAMNAAEAWYWAYQNQIWAEYITSCGMTRPQPSATAAPFPDTPREHAGDQD
ncbi:MAG: hypothetical protein AB7G93_19405 [Bdellovibrionales bacterium]